MNLATKIVVAANKEKLIKFTQRFCIKPISGFVYLKKAKRDNNKIIQINS